MRKLLRGVVPIVALVATATLVAAQTRDSGSERMVEHAGQSGAAAHSDASNDEVSLTPDQRNRLKAYFARKGARRGRADKPAFTAAIGAAVPRQIELRPLPSSSRRSCRPIEAINTCLSPAIWSSRRRTGASSPSSPM